MVKFEHVNLVVYSCHVKIIIRCFSSRECSQLQICWQLGIASKQNAIDLFLSSCFRYYSTDLDPMSCSITVN